MRNVFKISNGLQVLLLVFIILLILYVIVRFYPSKEQDIKYIAPIEYQNKNIISDEIKDALIQSYYNYIIEMNDSCQMLKFKGILNSRVNMP
jgi:hypothetical protein